MMENLDLNSKSSICIILPDLRGGGAERLHVNLAHEWVRRGFTVEFVLMNRVGELLEIIHPDVCVSELKVKRSRFLLLPLRTYLKERRPDVVIAAMWPITVVTVLAWVLSGRHGRVFVSDHSHMSISAVQELKVPVVFLGASMRLIYPLATGIIVVSKGVRDDICKLSGISPSHFSVIYNPAAIGSSRGKFSADARVGLWGAGFRFHVVAVGTLKAQKDHSTLIKAFALIADRINAKLTIIGDGPLRSELEGLVRELGIGARVALPGFTIDPSPWYQTADLFVLSSRWEGFGNVIVEALECGLPVVSTDCPSGPSEILEDGRFGELVPVESPAELAAAIERSLEGDHDREVLVSRARDFSVAKVASEYLSLIFP